MRPHRLTTASPGASASAATGATQSQAPTPTTEPVVFTTTPADDASDVAVDTRVTASAEKGTLTKASLSYTSKKGNRIPVDGTLKGGTWTAGDLLEPGVKYTLTMEAKDADGKTTQTTQTFRTANLTLDDQVDVAVSPRDGGTVGIGMPVVVRFDLPVVDKANFEKHMKVTATPAQAGSWYWLSSPRGALAPQDVLEGRHQGPRRGRPQRRARRRRALRPAEPTSDFTIGRSLIAKVNLKTDQMDVFINGKWPSASPSRVVVPASSRARASRSSWTSRPTSRCGRDHRPEEG